MPQYSTNFKQHVLEHYKAGVRGSGFGALAARFDIPGGECTIRGWHSRWDGSPASLQRKPGSGRKPILSKEEVQQHIVAPIRSANRACKAVHYAPIRAELIQATGKQPSLRTIRHYGQVEAVKQRRSKKRTADESKYTSYSCGALAVSMICADILCSGC
jgi:hypothetical protein